MSDPLPPQDEGTPKPRHEHTHAPANEPGLDTAQQSLSDALGVSFIVLKGLLFVLVVVYIFSGVFQVDEQNEAVRLRFGERVGTYKPGWHFGLPFPIEEVIQVPVNEQRVTIDKAFWYDDPDGTNNTAALARRPLNPLTDGFLITGDANVVHVQFVVTYKVSDVGLYIENVGDTERAEVLVRRAAERGIVIAMASAQAKQIIDRQFSAEAAATLARDVLGDLKTGIQVQSILLDSSSPPVQIQESAYLLVSAAEQDRGTAIQNARQFSAETLNGVAGSAHRDLTALIRAYEAASGANNTQLANALRAELDQSLTDLQMFGAPVTGLVDGYLDAMTQTGDDAEVQALRRQAGADLLAALQSAATAPREERSGRPVGGEVARAINNAHTYQTAAVSRIEAEYKDFLAYQELFTDQPQFTAHEIWHDSRTRILATGLIQTYYVDTRNLRINTTGDPAVEGEILEAMMAELRRQAQQQPGR